MRKKQPVAFASFTGDPICLHCAPCRDIYSVIYRDQIGYGRYTNACSHCREEILTCAEFTIEERASCLLDEAIALANG